jgi:hypothetical protein
LSVGPPHVLLDEGFDSQVALTAPLAELCQQVRRDAANLETGITPLRVTLALDFVADGFHLACQRIPVDLRQVGPTSVDLRRL